MNFTQANLTVSDPIILIFFLILHMGDLRLCRLT